MKKLLIAILLAASPALADDAPKPTLWLLAIQLKATTITLSYSTEAACRASAKLSAEHVRKIGRVDCIPVFQP